MGSEKGLYTSHKGPIWLAKPASELGNDTSNGKANRMQQKLDSSPAKHQWPRNLINTKTGPHTSEPSSNRIVIVVQALGANVRWMLPTEALQCEVSMAQVGPLHDHTSKFE